jgi:deazaflavin-dependent oxidoreductase (nitroreductase family)
MARSFRYSMDRRIVNRILSWLLEHDLGPQNYALLTVPGRKTGNPHTVPVALVVESERKWLVAPYGIADWVKNAEVVGEVTLSRGITRERFRLRKLSHEAAAPILKSYLKRYPITRPYFDATAESPLEAFEKEAEMRPVFELFPSTGT